MDSDRSGQIPTTQIVSCRALVVSSEALACADMCTPGRAALLARAMQKGTHALIKRRCGFFAWRGLSRLAGRPLLCPYAGNTVHIGALLAAPWPVRQAVVFGTLEGVCVCVGRHTHGVKHGRQRTRPTQPAQCVRVLCGLYGSGPIRHAAHIVGLCMCVYLGGCDPEALVALVLPLCISTGRRQAVCGCARPAGGEIA